MINPLHGPGVSAEEAEQIKRDFLAFAATPAGEAATIAVPGYSHPDIKIGYDPGVTVFDDVTVEYGGTDDGLKTTFATWVELPREEPTP